MAVFLLVPGAWHGAWCWAHLTPLLEQAGHQVITPDLSAIPPGANPFPIWAEQIAALAGAAPEPVIALGHSRGGIVVGEAAERAPEHFKQLIYLSAFLLPANETMQSAMARPEAGKAPDYLRPARGRCLTVAPEAALRFYHLADPASAAQAAAKLHAEPLGSFSAPASVTAARFGKIPRAYIECSYDRIIPLALQRSMQQALPCSPVLSLPSDHSPFLSMPRELAAALLTLA